MHLIRRSLRYVPRRELEKVAKDLKPIYTAGDQDQAWAALEAFDAKWGERFPPVVQAWQDAWEHFIPFLRFTDEVRRVVYTTNAFEALNRQLRKAIKTKGHFPSEDAARKLIYLAIQMRPRNGLGPGRRPRRCSRSRSSSATGSRTQLTPKNRHPTRLPYPDNQDRPHTSADALGPAAS